GHAQYVLLPGGVINARLAVGRHAVDLSLGPGARIEGLGFRIDGQRPDVALRSGDEYLRLAAGIDADDLPCRPGAGEYCAVGGKREPEALAALRGVDHATLPARRDLETPPLLAPRGCIQVAVSILNQVPDVGGLDAGQRLDLPRQAQDALAGDN